MSVKITMVHCTHRKLEPWYLCVRKYKCNLQNNNFWKTSLELVRKKSQMSHRSKMGCQESTEDPLIPGLKVSNLRKEVLKWLYFRMIDWQLKLTCPYWKEVTLEARIPLLTWLFWKFPDSIWMTDIWPDLTQASLLRRLLSHSNIHCWLLRPIPDREKDIKVAARGNEKPSRGFTFKSNRLATQDAFLVHDGCVAELLLTCVRRASHAPSVNGLTC